MSFNLKTREYKPKPVLTPETFDPERLTIKEKKDAGGPAGSSTYSASYAYRFPEGEAIETYPFACLPTFSANYGCTQRREKDGPDPTPKDKYGLTVGWKIVEDLPEGFDAFGDVPEIVKEGSKIVAVKDRVRKFRVFPSETKIEGRDVQITDEHAQLILAYLDMIQKIESRMLEQYILATQKPLKTVNRLIKSSSKTPYTDLHVKIGQSMNKDVGEMRSSCEVFIGEKAKIAFEEFLTKSKNARVAPWVSFPSLFVNKGEAGVRCSTYKIMCKKLGTDPADENYAVHADSENNPDTEGFQNDTEEGNNKRARVGEESTFFIE